MAQIAAEKTETAVPVQANPAPLGLSGFAITTFVLSAVNAGFIAGPDAFVIGLALAFGGLCQLLAGMWEFRAGNTLGATAFSSYGAFWISFAIAVLNVKALGGTTVGYYLLAWTILTAVFLISALRTNGALIAVFFFLTITFLALALGALVPSTSWTHIGGWLGIITAILAEYTALAGILSSNRGIIQLPIFPMS